jgi:UDP-N-acetylglucosamine enolpyruvyl transferase
MSTLTTLLGVVALLSGISCFCLGSILTERTTQVVITGKPIDLKDVSVPVEMLKREGMDVKVNSTPPPTLNKVAKNSSPSIPPSLRSRP